MACKDGQGDFDVGMACAKVTTTIRQYQIAFSHRVSGGEMSLPTGVDRKSDFVNKGDHFLD
jgi:hypothetical protein